MVRNLFIVTVNGIYIGKDTLHKNLAKRCAIDAKYIIFGGGMFEQHGTHFILFGSSYDFGEFDKYLVESHIKNNNIYWFNKKYEKFTVEIDLNRVE